MTFYFQGAFDMDYRVLMELASELGTRLAVAGAETYRVMGSCPGTMMVMNRLLGTE